MKILNKMIWGFLLLSVLVPSGVSAQFVSTSVRDRIYAAASSGNVWELKRLENLGYSLEMVDANGNTPYCQAVWSQNRTAVSTLIAAGVNVRPKCLRRIPYVTESRIYAAAHAEDLDQLVSWKKEGLNVDVVNPRTGNSALCEAVYNYDCPAIQTLLRAGSQQAQPCMRRVPQYVRDNLQCRPLKIDWSIVGYSALGAGMAGALVAVLASGGSKGNPTCTAQQRWIGDRCQSCETCWLGTTCITPEKMNDAQHPYYRDEQTAECWQVSPPPVEMTPEEFDDRVSQISTEVNSTGLVPYQKGNYLPLINAAAAYARGYTGYMVERTTPYGRPSNGTLNTPSISKEKVTVAVYSSGMTIGQGGKIVSTASSNTTGDDSTQLANGTEVWDWQNVNHAFYNAPEGGLKNTTYKPANGTTTTDDVTSSKVSEKDQIDTNLALNSSGTPYGYNFDYGPCGETKKNCYGMVEKTIDNSIYKLTVLYGTSETSYRYVTKDPTAGIVNGYTTAEPTADTITNYIDWDGTTGFQKQYFGALTYDTDYAWQNVKGTAYDADPTPHYTANADASYDGLDAIVGSKGTFLAGIVAAMKQDGGKTYGVAYDANILPVNRDVGYGISAEAMKVMTSNANIVLLDEGYVSSYVAATTSAPAKVVADALSAFTYNTTTQTYTARQMNELFGSDKANAYNYLKQNNAVAVVANGNAQDTHYHFMQPALQSAIPLMSGLNDINYNATTWKQGNLLPVVNENNPLYRLYLTVGAVQAKTVANTTYYNLESYSQPCGIAGSYCLVAPGGNSLVAGKELYSTTDLKKSGAGQNDYSYASSYGTSSAAAVVAGSLAVLMGAYPHLTTQQAVEILLKTATYLDLDNISDADQTADGEKVKDVYQNYFGASSYVGYDEKLDHYYNAIFGYGLVNLDAATDPIGGKDGLWVYKNDGNGTAVGSSSGVVKAATTAMFSPASLSGLSGSLTSSLPTNFVAFDAYNRPFLYPTAELFQLQNRRKAKTWNDFKMFMNNDWNPVVVQPSENFSMTYRSPTNRVASSSQIPLGLMQATLKQNKMKYTLFYSQDTTQGTGAYWQRRQSNPFIQMKDAYGLSSACQFNPKWSVEVGWTMGRNGFFDEDDRHFDAPDNKMQALSTSVVFKPAKKISLKVASGIMKESGSSLGMVSSGAFNIQGATTQYLGAGVEFSPIEKVHLEAMYYYGQTKTTSKGGLMNLSRMASDSFALTASYEPTENQLFGFQISSPLRVRKGALNVSLPVGRHPTEDIYYYQDYQVDMKPKARELDLSMYYQGNVAKDVSLQGEVGIRLNPDHQADVAPDYRGMLGLKWNY